MMSVCERRLILSPYLIPFPQAIEVPHGTKNPSVFQPQNDPEPATRFGHTYWIWTPPKKDLIF
jgi:hypothetical protein